MKTYKQLFVLLTLIICMGTFVNDVFALDEFSQKTSRLLVNIESNASFSSAEFAEASSARLVTIEERNPFKPFPEIFLNHPFVVISCSLNHQILSKLVYTYGYRAVNFSEEILENAVEQAKVLLATNPKFSSDIPSMSVEESHQLYQLYSARSFEAVKNKERWGAFN